MDKHSLVGQVLYSVLVALNIAGYKLTAPGPGIDDLYEDNLYLTRSWHSWFMAAHLDI